MRNVDQEEMKDATVRNTVVEDITAVTDPASVVVAQPVGKDPTTADVRDDKKGEATIRDDEATGIENVRWNRKGNNDVITHKKTSGMNIGSGRNPAGATYGPHRQNKGKCTIRKWRKSKSSSKRNIKTRRNTTKIPSRKREV